MKELISKLLQNQCFESNPPILVDIGASGEIFPKWKDLVPYSHCVAFEPDDRESNAIEGSKNNWKKLTSFRSIVTSEKSAKLDFYLTKSPFCSSILKPDNKSLPDWEFAHLFEIEKMISIDSITLKQSLIDSGITNIDWFKTDSQGTDLRLFASLPDEVQKRTIVADFEPGIIDAYESEDKLHHVLAFMEKKPFWVSSMEIKGSKRILKSDSSTISAKNTQFISKQKSSPCWCEISYINNMKSSQLGLRENILSWIFSTILEQHGFALGIARRGTNSHKNIFSELYEFSLSKLS
jgi:hypothetical protein